MILFWLALLEWSFATPDYSKIASSRAWLNLVHYQKTLLGYKSEADGPDFFLSPEGPSKPLEELSATIHALQDPTKLYGRIRAPAYCVFVGRRIFLEKSGFAFPKVNCPDFEGWRQGLPVESIGLVFATAYPNNPASMFGHTFLRLHGPGGGKDLLDYAINFAATTGSDTGMTFALLGVVGGYEGHYSLAPYFIKVNEYNHGEARDLWEYPVKMSQVAIDLMLAHLWELEATTYFNYYFFDENCSWQLARLLEAADPSLDLQTHIPFYVIPSETVRALKKAGRLGDPVFRPSLRRHWLERAKRVENKRDEIDLKLERFRLRERLSKLSVSEQEDYHALLVERSQDPHPPRPITVTPAVNRPDQGHHLARLGLTQGDGFHQLQWRFAQHDLLDADQGHERWSALDLMRLTVEERGRQIFFRDLYVADVVSLHDWNQLGFSPSWLLKFGMEQPREFFCRDCTTASFRGGLGSSWRFQDERIVVGVFGSTRAFGFNPYHAGPWIGLGGKALAGIRAGDAKMLFELERVWGLSSGDPPWAVDLSLALNVGQWSLRPFLKLHYTHGTFSDVENGLTLFRYF